MSNLQTYYHFKLDFQKVDQYTGGKWLIHSIKHHKDDQLQSLDWIGLDLFNDNTCPSGYISRPSQVGISHNCSSSINWFYSTCVQIVSCTLSSDLEFSESTGSFNPVLSVSANEFSFDKNLANQIIFQLMALGLEEHYSPSPLGDFNRLFWRPNWSIIPIMIFKHDLFFKCHYSGPKKLNLYHWFAGKSKLNAVSTWQSKSEQTWFPWCLMFRDPGSVLILGQVTQYGNPYLIGTTNCGRVAGLIGIKNLIAWWLI